MERLRRLAQLWNWLPAFRAVGETQHLPTASRALSVTAPALSRAVRLLERDLGQPLFRRIGRRIELNEAGVAMLEAVRDAMRLVHEGLLEIRAEGLSGRVRVCSAGVITTAHVTPALQALRRAHRDLVPVVETADPAGAAPMLLRGTLDVIFHSATVTHPQLRTLHLGTESSSVYCGPGHPLYGRRKATLEEVTAHAFVAASPEHGPTEGWPVEVERHVGMYVDQMRVGCEICATGDLLAVLPDVVARSFASGKDALHRLPLDLIPPTHLFATLRPALGGRSKADVVVEAVQKHIQARR